MQAPATASSRLRVGEFEVDLRCGEVRRNGEKIKLQQRPFQIFAALLQHPGEVVTREEIRQNLWPTDTFVDFEHSINTAVNKLREALGDDVENPRFIETLPRYGYRLIAPVEIVEPNGICPEAETLPAPPQKGSPPQAASPKRRLFVTASVVTLLAIASLALFFLLPPWRHTGPPPRETWVQITNFSESTTSPALSPDGHMIAFIQGSDTFVTRGQIYVKMLPDGQPVQLTHDDLPKMAPTFSPDGSRIAYTATDSSFGWNTWVVPVLGGEPRQLLPNASGLTWADKQHVVFSEIRTGQHMGVVTATESRAGERDIYLPPDIVGMAHRSWVSPDGKWILVSEMDGVGWRPCRLLPFDGSTRGQTAGPKTAACTSASWSADGKTMYFSANAGDGYHIWRQHFPRGLPEQITFGPTEEEGIAISPDGHTLVTSAGIRESTVWVHDSRGDRQVSGEGFASLPGLGGDSNIHSVFSPDGKKLFYLVGKRGSRAFNSGELWMTDLDSDRTETVLPGVSMIVFDISPDGKQVAFVAQDAEEAWHTWVASLDRRTPPKQLTSSAREPRFGPQGEIYFVTHEGSQEFVYRIGPNETLPRKMVSEPVTNFAGISPRGDWWLFGHTAVVAKPAQGGAPTPICGFCGVGWEFDGKFLYLRFRKVGEMGGGRAFAIALPAGKDLPVLPPSGLKSIDDVGKLNVVADIDTTGMAVFAPGPDPSTYAYVRRTVQRNLFQIPLK
jgi:Tol biopolymer transport system component/DNA-binding winged helix-turn-helix (wHTH) protein